MKNDEKEGMWRVIYSVSPEPPKGDKLEKVTNLSPYTYSALADFRSKRECGDGKGKK